MRVCAVGFLAFCLGLAAGCHVKGGIIHRVEKGDSLLQIAHVYSVEVYEILRANPRLEPDHIRPGQKILVPGATRTRRIGKKVWDEATRGPSPVATVSKKGVKVSAMPKFIWPGQGKVISPFGMRNQKMHSGIDIRVHPSDNILAAAAGKVVYTGNDIEGYGNLVILRHESNLFSIYAFVGKVLVPRGKSVGQGDTVAAASVDEAKAYFHFEMRQGKKAFDPIQFLPPGG